MNKNNSTSDQNDKTSVTPSLRLALLASALTTIADAIAMISALEAINEAIAEDRQTKQDQKELDEKLQKMQNQINRLTDELLKIKKKMP